jgi:crotonobetainyl-CoA:carnitine CoA-transferase CaiB-like acyl-CoA transferase
VPERLGIDDATLRAANPRLVYVYAGSYGSTGPCAALPAFHVTAGAILGGALAQSGRDGVPGPEVALTDDELAWWSRRLMRCNESNPDFNAALTVAAAVTMALFARARTGAGQAIETRMMAANAYVLSEHFVEYASRPARVLPDAELYGLHAGYRLYRAADGWVFVAGAAERAEELAEEWQARFATRPVADCVRELTGIGVACVRVHDGIHADYVMEAPWARPLGFVEQSAASGLGPYERYGRVVQHARNLGPPGPADRAGAQTRAILGELRYAESEVARLLADGIVSTPE